jgi:hypothetical protein
MADSGGNSTGDIIRNILLFLIVGAVIVVGILYVMSEVNSEEATTEGLGWATSMTTFL